MAWTFKGPGVKLYEDGYHPANLVGFVTGTSTCTIRPDSSSPELRMFGLSARAIQAVARSASTRGTYTGTSLLALSRIQEPCGCSVTNCQPYAVGDSFPDGATFRLESMATARTEPLRSTCVADLRSARRELVVLVAWGLDPTTLVFDVRSVQELDFQVVYKDPFVLYVASISKWVMLMTRLRKVGGSTSGSPNDSISDIVAFTADDSEFTVGVSDPYWVANSLDALGGVIPYRLWLSVPTALEHTDTSGVTYLYVYFVAEPCDLTATSGALGITSPDLDTEATAHAYPGSAFPGALGMRKIATTYFLGTTLPEEDWESATDGPDKKQLPGESVGLVRIWLAVTGSPFQVLSFEDVYTDAKAVDPCVVSTGAGFSLFFATNSRTATFLPNNGHGIWRASSFDESVVVSLEDVDPAGTTTYASTFGIDWVLRGVSIGIDATTGDRILTVATDDNVQASVSNSDAVLDPDAVQLDTTEWRVFYGHGDSLGVHLVIDASSGDDTDCNVKYDDCW